MHLRISLLAFISAAIFLTACTPIVDPGPMATDAVTEAAPTPLVIQSAADVPRVSVEEAKMHFDNAAAVFIDARSTPQYERAHIAGALPLFSVPPYASSNEELDAALAAKELIITYCT